MAGDELTTVYLDTTGIPTVWMSTVARALVRDGLAATADISRQRHHDSGAAVRAMLHTRSVHVPAIRARAEPVAAVRAYPLQCSDDHATWVLEHTL